MNEFIEKLIGRLEEEKAKGIYDIDNVITVKDAYGKAIKIVNQLAEEHNNGWILCEERLPDKRDWYLAMFQEVESGFIGLPFIADYLMGVHTKYTTDDGWIVHNGSDREDESAEYYKNLRCVAWQPLPQPYQPKGDGK